MLLGGTGDALLVLHVGSECPEHQEKEGETREHDAHRKHGDADAVGILLLQKLRLAQAHVLWQIARGDESGNGFIPCLEITVQCIAFVGFQYWHTHGVYQVYGVSIIKRYPVGLLFLQNKIEMKRSGVGRILCLPILPAPTVLVPATAVEDDDALLAAQHGSGFIVRQRIHHLPTYFGRQVLVENSSVGG